MENRPDKNNFENKKYFNKWNHLYGFKTEVSVLLSWIVILTSATFQGSVSDNSIFRSQLKWHQLVCEKIRDMKFCEQSASNAKNNFTEKRSILLDKEYCGLDSEVNSVTKKRKQTNVMLTATDRNRNKSISQDWEIVEKCFGRLHVWYFCTKVEMRWVKI